MCASPEPTGGHLHFVPSALSWEPKELRLVSPNRDTAPNILLLHCVKHGRPELRFLDPLYVYNDDGSYTDEIERLYERR